MSDELESVDIFEDFHIDDRILKAISDLKWTRPTAIQQRAIPLALEGKDILARACTGSGKTGAFAVPLIHKILERKKATGRQCIRAVILAPTKELCSQICSHIQKLCAYCSREVRCVDLAVQSEIEAQKPLLATLPDVLVTTPNKILNHLKAENLKIQQSLEFLIVDEADLVLSFGYEEDMQEIVKYLPTSYQAFLTSATMNENIKLLKNLLLKNPVTLKLQEAQLPSSSQLSQFHVKCIEEDKFVLLYALLKLRLVKGRSIIFVSSVDRCYSCHIVQQFNEGVYDFIISADESFVQRVSSENSKKVPKRIKDPESGVARGIDFHQVANVVNFDFPRTLDEYVHRVGRTARAFNEGTALSFIAPPDEKSFKRISSVLSKQYNEDIFKPYQFRMEELDGFKYRAKDAYRAVTNTAVKEARLKDIKEEIMKSDKLKSYFAKNPRDLNILLHDKDLHTIKIQPHLQHVPDYIVPPSLQGANYSAPLRTRKRKVDKEAQMSKGQKKFMRRKADPLENFDI